MLQRTFFIRSSRVILLANYGIGMNGITGSSAYQNSAGLGLVAGLYRVLRGWDSIDFGHHTGRVVYPIRIFMLYAQDTAT